MNPAPMNIGLSREAREKIAPVLRRFLANTYVLYTKTQVFHWNVEGALFHSYHHMFEEQYSALSEQIDDIAERLRVLGYKTPHGLQDLLSLATVKESTSGRNAAEMIQELLQDHEEICRQLREDIEEADDADDVGTEDFLTSRLEAHEKTAWMLRSS